MSKHSILNRARIFKYTQKTTACLLSIITNKCTNMKLKRKYITPYLTWTFVVIGITGILMTFHVFEGFIEVVHGLLGLIFIIFSILHLVINWRSLKPYFKKSAFIVSLFVTIAISILIINQFKGFGEEERTIMKKLTKAPIHQTLKILEIDYSEAILKLKNNKIDFGNSKTIDEIGFNNHIAPDEILEMIVK